jgi:hypothetical protein
MAKTAPYWLATGTHSLLATGTINRMAAPVTFTTATAVPLCLSFNTLQNIDNLDNKNLSIRGEWAVFANPDSIVIDKKT